MQLFISEILFILIKMHAFQKAFSITLLPYDGNDKIVVNIKL